MDMFLSLAAVLIVVTTVVSDQWQDNGFTFYPTGAETNFSLHITPPENKINPANPVKQNEFPFVVYLRTSSFPHVCTGSLIERRWVMTAAHCVNYRGLYIVLGDFMRSEDDGTEQIIQIDEIVVHPDYPRYPDIALIKLENPADIRSEAVAKIAPLASKSFLAKVLNNEKKCKVLGMGVAKYGTVWASADIVQQQDVRFVSDEEAQNRSYTIHPTVVNTEAIYQDECNTGAVCSGDSGGPIVCRKSGGWVQVGIVSFGSSLDGCMEGVKGNVNVQYMSSWISSVTGK